MNNNFSITTIDESIVNEEYKNFIKLINKVFPIEVETIYINLSNYINKYFVILSKYQNLDLILFNLNNDLFVIDKQIKIMIEKKAKLNTELDKAYSTLITMQNYNYSYKLWLENKNNIEEEIKKIEKEIEVLKTELDNKKNEIEKSKILKKQYFTLMSQLINDIIIIINQINLHYDKYNLDNYKILLKDLFPIRNMSLDKERKLILEELFKLYIPLRIETFKMIKNISMQTILLYNQDKTFINNSFDLDLKNNYELAISILDNFNINDIVSSIFDEKINEEKINTQIQLMSIIKDYFSSGKVDLSKLKDYRFSKENNFTDIIWHLYGLPSKKTIKK